MKKKHDETPENFFDVETKIEANVEYDELTLWHITKKRILHFLGIGDIHESSKSSRFRERVQKAFFNYARELVKKVGKIEVLLLMGDLAEGKDKRGGGVHLETTNTDSQVDRVVKKLQDLIDIIKPEFVIGVGGSPYHRQDGNSDLDRRVLVALARQNPKIKFIFGETLFLEFGRMNWYLRHHYSTGRLRTWQLEAFSQDWITNAELNGGEQADVFGFAHVHIPIHPHQIMTGEKTKWAFVTPGLKANDRFLKSKNRPKTAFIGVTYIKQNDKELTGETKKLLRPLKRANLW